MGGLFAYDLFLYSQAQLLGELDGVAWALRGLLAAVMLVPFTWGIWKMPASEVRVFVSRHVVFYSSAFVAVGLYLSLMAVGGYYVREHGGSWGNALQIVFLCGAAAILVSLLLSESPMRRLRVFISTHFYRNKYDYRITWLRFIDTLSSSEDDDVRRTVVRAVAQVFAVPGWNPVHARRAVPAIHPGRGMAEPARRGVRTRAGEFFERDGGIHSRTPVDHRPERIPTFPRRVSQHQSAAVV